MNENRFTEVFQHTPVILPVIHFYNFDQALGSAQVACEARVDGIWLIDHKGNPPQNLIEVTKSVKASYPSLWVGINFLNLDPLDLVENYICYLHHVDGIWIDDLGLGPEGVIGQSGGIVAGFKKSHYPGLLFAGVAFKYRAPIPDHDLPEITRKAASIGEFGVITTSGPATGSPPDLTKIRKMSDVAHLNNCPLAVASGMTAENIGQFLPYVDAFLIGTSLEDPKSHLLVPEKLAKLLAAVRIT